MRERRYKYTVWGGPFGKLRDQGSFGTVSELVELAVISCAGTEKSLRYACIALKGQNEIALGKWPNKTPSPERAKGVVK